jgi:hypothetical protein
MAPADLKAVTNTAKRMALNRAGLEAKQVPLLIPSDDQAKQSRRLAEPQRRLNKGEACS